MQKSGKFQGGHDKIDWKSRGFNFKELISSAGGGVQFFSEKAQFQNLI